MARILVAAATALLTFAVSLGSPVAAEPGGQARYPAPVPCPDPIDCSVNAILSTELRHRFDFEAAPGPNGGVQVTVADDTGLPAIFVVTWIPFQTFESRQVCVDTCLLIHVENFITVSVSPLDITGQELLDHTGSIIPTTGTIAWQPV